MIEFLKVLIFVAVCFSWGAMGFFTGSEYQKTKDVEAIDITNICDYCTKGK